MGVRVRFFFAKRGRAAFLPHVELPPIFVRSARRAGLVFEYSEGCVPHPRLSLGPTLPLGIVALDEPAEGWFTLFPPDAVALWRDKLPPGLELLDAFPVEGPTLAASCRGRLGRRGSVASRLPCQGLASTVPFSPNQAVQRIPP